MSRPLPNLSGPSREFSSDLCEEDDDANPILLGRKTEVLVVDLSDAVLGECADYDPVTHDFAACAAFDADRPVALPLMTDVLQEIRDWLGNAADDRGLFLLRSRRPGASCPSESSRCQEKLPAKEGHQPDHYGAPHHVGNPGAGLSCSTRRTEKCHLKAPSATPAPGPAKLMPITSKVPAVSSNFPAATGATSAIAKLVGPPPKTKAFVVSAAEEGQEAGGVQADPAGESPDQSNIVKAIS